MFVKPTRGKDGVWTLSGTCPYCGLPHEHGGGFGRSPDAGHRVSHCLKNTDNEGYNLVIDDDEGQHDERLHCNIKLLTYDFSDHEGTAEFPADNCCDMQGIIDLFTHIDKGCKRIQTYANGKLDTVYKRDYYGEWDAL